MVSIKSIPLADTLALYGIVGEKGSQIGIAVNGWVWRNMVKRLFLETHLGLQQ